MGLKKGLFASWALLLAIYLVAWIVFEMDNRTRGGSLYGRGEYARAIEMFNRVIAKKSDARDLAEMYVARGQARLRLGDPTGALEDAEKGLSLWPGYAFGYLLRSEIRLAAGDAQSALDDSNAAIESDATFPWSYWGRGNVRRELGDLDGALADYEKAFQLKPNMLALAWDRLRPLRPVEAWYTDRSITKRLKGDLDGALADCEEPLKLNGSFARAVLNRGLVYLLQGRNDEAEKDFKRFVELRPTEKAYLDAEIEWARAGVTPKAAKVFLARTASPAAGSPGPEQAEGQTTGAKNDEAGSTPEQQPPAGQTTGLIGFLNRPLPRVVTLCAGLALIFVFTGSYLVLKDMERALSEEVSREFRGPLQLAIRFIRIRRALCLLTGLGLAAAYFFDKRLPVFLAIVVGIFFLSSVNKVGTARQLVTDARGRPS